MKAFIKELWSRFRAETPDFFKKLRNIAIIAGALGTSILGAQVINPNIYMPESLQKVASFMIYGGIIAAGTAQLAKKDK